MLELVFANLRVRPFRTIISIVGVALGVVLVVMFTGLARGMTQDLAKRSANWKAESSQRWTVPVGGGIGKIFHLGKLPVNTQLSAYYNVVTPDDGSNWQIRFQVQFMFPK